MIEKKESTKQFSDRLKTLVPSGSGRDFAKRAGIGYSTVHNYLQAISSPTLENLVLLARAGNVSVEWLATGKASLVSNAQEHALDVPFIDNPTKKLIVDSELLSTPDVASLVALSVDNDTMYPTLNYGSVLVIDTKDKELKDNKLVVLFQSNNYLIKRVQVKLDGVYLLSDNNVYPSIYVDRNASVEMNIIGTGHLIINKNHLK